MRNTQNVCGFQDAFGFKERGRARIYRGPREKDAEEIGRGELRQFREQIPRCTSLPGTGFVGRRRDERGTEIPQEGEEDDDGEDAAYEARVADNWARVV